jgi:glucosylceramidase
MRSKISICLLTVASILIPLTAMAQKNVTVWLTKPDQSALFERQTSPLHFTRTTGSAPVIDVDEKRSFQSIDGFGFALTGGSAQLIVHMSPAKRTKLLRQLFATDGDDIGISYLRVSIGSSDMSERVFSYDDLPAGETDPTLAKFSLGPDRADVIPVLKEILAINPKIKILGSPWSAPAWMKSNGDVKGGELKPEYYAAYASYFVKYIEGMKAEGIPIDAITVQNEPLNPKNTPSMVMQASDQDRFIKNDLGPAFQKAGIRTKIILYDHNCDRPDYPLFILKDPAASKYVDGSGFHLYGGRIEALTEVHDAFPKKNLYFTEQMVVSRPGAQDLKIADPVARILIGATRNWSRNVLLWNLAADPENGPHTNNGGCTMCQGAITIDGDKVTRNLAYYTVAHASKFVRPGSVRIASSESGVLPNVAFRTAKGRKVLIVANTGSTSQRFSVRYGGKAFTADLDAGAVATYLW